MTNIGLHYCISKRLVQPSTSTAGAEARIKTEPVSSATATAAVGASRSVSLGGPTGGGSGAAGAGPGGSAGGPGSCLEENNSKFEIGEDVAFVASVMQHAQEVASLGELGKATDP